jgi:sortase A
MKSTSFILLFLGMTVSASCALFGAQGFVVEAAPSSPVQTEYLPAAADKRIAEKFPAKALEVAIASKPVEHKAEAHLLIPKLGVNAPIKAMGYTAAGAMAVPNNTVDVGWFSPGIQIGAVGSAVIGAHNVWTNGNGVFVHLDQLTVGDGVTVLNVGGTSITFIVRETRTYSPTDDAEEIFNSGSGTHLNLITCSGTFDQKTGTYTKRLVVFTDAV